MTRVGISLVCHGRLEEVQQTLSCVRALSPPPHRVCVVDNASPGQEQLKELRQRFPEFQWLCEDTNLGYGEGHHQALRWLLEQGCETFLLLNPDLRFPPDTLWQFQQASEQCGEQWILGPLLVQEEGEDPRLDSAGLVLDVCFRAKDRGQGLRRSQLWELSMSSGAVLPVWGLCGAALWIPRSLVPLHPGRLLFAPDYFAYFEDVELALYCQRQQIRMGLLTDLLVVHRRGGFGRLSQITSEDWEHRPAAVRGALLNRLCAWRRYSPSSWQYPLFGGYELARGIYLFWKKPFLRPLLSEAWRILRRP